MIHWSTAVCSWAESFQTQGPDRKPPAVPSFTPVSAEGTTYLTGEASQHGAGTNTTKAMVNTSLPLHFQAHGKCPAKPFQSSFCMAEQAIQVTSLFLPASCHNFQESPWSLTQCPCYPILLLHTPMHFLSLPLIFFTLHSSKQQYWSHYLQKLINCSKPADSTKEAKFTFSLYSFFLTQAFLILTQIINRAGLKLSTQNWDFMENMHLITLNFAWHPFSSVINN